MSDSNMGIMSKGIFGIATSGYLGTINLILGTIMLLINIAILAPVAWEKYFKKNKKK